MYIDAERLRDCRISAGLSLRDLADLCNISKSAIANFEYCRRQPKVEAVRAIASALNVSVEYLTGESNIKTPTKSDLSESERAWIELYRRLSPDVRETFVTMVKTFDSLPEGERQMLLAMIRGALGSQAK